MFPTIKNANYLEIKTFEKFKFEKKIESTPSAGEKMRICGGEENFGKWVRVNVGNFYYWFLIFWREKFKISTHYLSKIERSKTHQIAVLPH